MMSRTQMAALVSPFKARLTWARTIPASQVGSMPFASSALSSRRRLLCLRNSGYSAALPRVPQTTSGDYSSPCYISYSFARSPFLGHAGTRTGFSRLRMSTQRGATTPRFPCPRIAYIFPFYVHTEGIFGHVAYVASDLGYSREEVSLEKTYFSRYIRYTPSGGAFFSPSVDIRTQSPPSCPARCPGP